MKKHFVFARGRVSDFVRRLSTAIVLFAGSAHADITPDMTNAPFPAVVTGLDFNNEVAHDKYGCQLMTTSDDIVRLRWIPSETSVERMSVRDNQVKARQKISVTKLAEKDGAAVYGYREANAVVLIVPAMDSFGSTTGSGDRLFMQQQCGIGLTLLFTKPLSSDISTGCNTREGGTHFPGFCGRLARLDGRVTETLSYSMSAGLGEGDKVRILLKTHATKPDGTPIDP